MSRGGTYLVGCGGHGRVVLDALLARGVTPAGILDRALAAGTEVFGVPVLGGDEWLARLGDGDVCIVGVGANPSTDVRRRVHERVVAAGRALASVVHPAAHVGRDCSLGAGSQVLAGATLQCGVRLGDGAVVNTRASLDHDVAVGAHAFVSPGATVCGDVRVGDGAFVGAGAVVVPGVTIGADAIVGAGAVVTRDVAPGTTVVGNPARETRG